MKSSFLIERAAAAAALLAGAACAATVCVPAGETKCVPAGTVFEGEVLVQTGPGALDLSGAVLRNAGLEVREGTVRFAPDAKTGAVLSRFVRFTVSASRPNAPYSGQAWQISEFNVAKDGKVVPCPEGTAGTQNGDPGGREGAAKAVDGNIKTKFLSGYNRCLEVDFGRPVLFDGYTFTTANDAIGRDPRDFTLDVGDETPCGVRWANVSSEKGFACTEQRFVNAGKIFPVRRMDKVPCCYPVTVRGSGRLVLSGLSESLEAISGDGLVVVDGGSLEISEDSPFVGSVCGGGKVIWH